jgi:plasmid stabilization system protein ParE
VKPRLSEDAARDVSELRIHYARKGRPEAVRNLRFAVEQAADRIDRDPQAGLAAPRP